MVRFLNLGLAVDFFLSLLDIHPNRAASLRRSRPDALFPNWSLTKGYQHAILACVIRNINSNACHTARFLPYPAAERRNSAKPFRIRTYEKCARNSFRIRRSKNKGLKVL
jgi:hypothetical protein